MFFYFITLLTTIKNKGVILLQLDMNNIEFSKIGNIAITQLENIYSHEWDELNHNILLMNKRLKVVFL